MYNIFKLDVNNQLIKCYYITQYSKTTKKIHISNWLYILYLNNYIPNYYHFSFE